VPVDSSPFSIRALCNLLKIRSIRIEQLIQTERKQKLYQILTGPKPWRDLFYPTPRNGQASDERSETPSIVNGRGGRAPGEAIICNRLAKSVFQIFQLLLRVPDV
jgi:hypothetical protein